VTQDAARPLREEALRLFGAGLAAADPAPAVRAALSDRPALAGPGGRVFVIAAGKASCVMTRAALDAGVRPFQTLVIAPHAAAAPSPDAQLITAGHPVPDAGSFAAGEAVCDLLDGARAGDLVLALISGGASALMISPAGDLTLDDKARVNAALLRSGADIHAVNAVRQQLSRLKGGGFVRLAAPARVRALIVSDVIGGDERVIASGLTARALTDRAGAAAILRRHGVWKDAPEAVRRLLSSREEAASPAPEADNAIILSNRTCLEAMARAAPGARIVCDHLTGDVADAARFVGETARAAPAEAGVFLFGGETTVRVSGAGLGGRNQELALRTALMLEGLGRPFAFLSGGTDGKDGPTDAAGGLTDAGAPERIRAAGGDPEALLADNDSFRALALSGDLVRTGATGFNAADLQVLVLGPGGA